MRSRSIPTAAGLAGMFFLACGVVTGPDWPTNPRFAGCSSDELRAITHSHRDAAHLADDAFEAFESPANRARAERDEWDVYRWWFGEFGPRRFDAARSVLATTRAEFDHTVSIRCGSETVSCAGEGAIGLPGSNMERSAYSNFQIHVVQVCPDFFGRSRAEQASILFHQLARIASDALEVASSEPELLALAREDPGLAVRNAASFTAFAESVAYGRKPGAPPREDATGAAAD